MIFGFDHDEIALRDATSDRSRSASRDIPFGGARVIDRQASVGRNPRLEKIARRNAEILGETPAVRTRSDEESSPERARDIVGRRGSEAYTLTYSPKATPPLATPRARPLPTINAPIEHAELAALEAAGSLAPSRSFRRLASIGSYKASAERYSPETDPARRSRTPGFEA